jgi:hypothetical protein
MRTNLGKTITTSCALMLAMGAGGLGAGPINLDTGQPGVLGKPSDLNWTIVSAPFGDVSGKAVLIKNPIWNTPPVGSDWIATEPDSGAGGPSSGDEYPGGTYTYETLFSGSAGSLSLSVEADNSVCAYLNGQQINLNGGAAISGGNGECWGDPTGASVNPSEGWSSFGTATVTTGFLATNTLEMVVTNEPGADSYTGLLVEGSFTPSPEPTPVILTLIGIVFLGTAVWHRFVTARQLGG